MKEPLIRSIAKNLLPEGFRIINHGEIIKEGDYCYLKRMIDNGNRSNINYWQKCHYHLNTPCSNLSILYFIRKIQ